MPTQSIWTLRKIWIEQAVDALHEGREFHTIGPQEEQKHTWMQIARIMAGLYKRVLKEVAGLSMGTLFAHY